MRVNIYAEEMTNKVEIVSKTINGQEFTGLRLYMELPVTTSDGQQIRGPFMHSPGDNDSAAVTFWGKKDLRPALLHAVYMLDSYYAQR